MSIFTSWEEMDAGERMGAMKQRKANRQKNKNERGGDGTIVEDFDDSFDDDFGQSIDAAGGGSHTVVDGEGGVLDPEFMRQAILEHARFLGMDPEEHEHLLWIAEEALTAALPEDWEQGVSEDGTPYHFNTKTKESMWEHPLDEHYRQMFQEELKKCEEQDAREKMEKQKSVDREKAKEAKLEERRRQQEQEQKLAKAAAEAAAKREAEKRKSEKEEEERQYKSSHGGEKMSRRSRHGGSGNLASTFETGDILDSMTEKLMSKPKSKKGTEKRGKSSAATGASPKTASWMDDIADALDADASIDHITDKSMEMEEEDVPLFGSVKVESVFDPKDTFRTTGSTRNGSFAHGDRQKSPSSLAKDVKKGSDHSHAKETAAIQKELERVRTERDEIRKEHDRIVCEKEELSSNLSQERKDHDVTKGKLDKAQKEIHQAADEGSSHLRAEIEQLRKHLKTSRDERSKLSTSAVEGEEYKLRAEEAENELIKARQKTIAEGTASRQAAREKKEAVEKMETVSRQLDAVVKENETLKESMQTAKMKIDALKHAKLALQSEVERLIEEKSVLQSNSKQATGIIERNLSHNKEQLIESKKLNEVLKKEKEDLITIVEELKRNHSERENRMKQLASKAENDTVRSLKDDFEKKMNDVLSEKKTAASVAEVKIMKLRQQIEETKVLSAKASAMSDTNNQAQKLRIIELEEDRNTLLRKKQEVDERLAIVEALRAEDQAECVQQRRAAMNAQEEAENFRRRLANSANEERVLKLTRDLETVSTERDKVKKELESSTIQMNKSKLKFKSMLETAMRRAAAEASLDTMTEWKEKTEAQQVESRELNDELKSKLHDALDESKRKDRELIDFERKYARSSASLEVKEKEVMTLKSEIEDMKRELAGARTKLMTMASEKQYRPTMPAAPEVDVGSLNFSIPQYGAGNISANQNLQMGMLNHQLSVMKSRTDGIAAMVASVQKSKKASETEPMYQISSENENSLVESTEASNASEAQFDISSKTHRVLSDLNISFGKDKLSLSRVSRASSRPGSVPGVSKQVYTTIAMSPSFIRDSGYQKGYWKRKYVG